MGDCPKELLTFNETETEMLKNYQEGGAERVIMPDGSLKLPWDECFKVKGEHFFDDKTVIPEGLAQREIPFRETYATFEEYVKDWCGSEERDPDKGVFGYWENKNAKWDWFTIGGRWTGYFLQKKAVVTQGVVGHPGLMTPPAEEGRVDQVRKGDVDFDGMRNDAERTARQSYAIIVGTTGLLTHRPWSAYREDLSYGANWDARREDYRNQPAYRAAQQAVHQRAETPGLSKEDKDLLRWADLDDYLCTEDEYAQRRRDRTISTFAVLKGGIWYEKGSMGWWGCVSDPKDESEWLREFNLMLDTLDGDTLLTVVDCHI